MYVLFSSTTCDQNIFFPHKYWVLMLNMYAEEYVGLYVQWVFKVPDN
jgi:hypothetical protein